MSIQGLGRIAPALLVLFALAPFTYVAVSNLDLPQFGRYQDDGLFLIGAQSLAEGDGYRISSLPGRPFQTKYPPLFSALLTPVWALGSELPANLRWAGSFAFGIVLLFFAAIYKLARSFEWSPLAAAWMVGFLATSPWLVYWALIPVSDFLFSFFVVAAVSVLHARRGDLRWTAVAGVLAAAAYLTKAPGILLVPAMLLGAWRRRDWKGGLVFTVPVLTACLGWGVWASLHRTSGEHPVFWYYTDYFAVALRNGWATALPEIFESNLRSMAAAVGNTVLFHMADSIAGRLFGYVLLAGVVSGVCRLLRRTGSVEYPAFCAMFAALLLVWSFSPNARLMAPLFPILVLGLFEEAAHVGAMLRAARLSRKALDRRVAQTFRCLAITGVLAALSLNVRFIAHGIPQLLDADRQAAQRTRAVFEWCRRTLPPSSVVVAENDTALYLSTGLRAVRAVPNSVAFYKQDTAGKLKVFTEMDRLAGYFGATHLILAPEDFGDFEPDERRQIVKALVENPRHTIVYRAGDHVVFAMDREPHKLSRYTD